jgi:hypothetical protein
MVRGTVVGAGGGGTGATDVEPPVDCRPLVGVVGGISVLKVGPIGNDIVTGCGRSFALIGGLVLV